jgi:hypothetical protein
MSPSNVFGEFSMRHLNSLEHVINIDKYPICDSKHPRFQELVNHCRAELAADGCCSLPRFFRPEVIQIAASMAEGLQDKIHRPREDSTPYGGDIDLSLPDDHPRRITYRRGGGFICADLLDPASALWTFFRDPNVTQFMMEAFGTRPLYRYADPLSSMAINSMGDGDEFPWHFDTNEFTVSIMLQKPQSGGVFEYIPNIRTPDNEHYDRVRQVFDGDRKGVKTINLQPCDMQLFKGRYTLHRVTPVHGDLLRHVALPSWSSRPDQVGVPGRMIKSYGRVLPIHYERHGQSPDQLAQ